MYDNINIAVGGPINADYPKVYKTKFLKPGIPVSLQVTEPNTKYVIKYNFDLDGGTVTIPKGCLLEFDGGSVSNGTVEFDNTILIYNQQEEDVLKNIIMVGDYEVSAGGKGDKKDNINGMGKIYLKKNKGFAEQLTQDNTIYVIQYDFTLGEDITVPANCVLKFEGGSISGAYTLTGTHTDIQSGLVKIFNTDITLAGTYSNLIGYVEWFGAKGDNTTDDRIAIQSAVDSVFPCIELQNKKYVINSYNENYYNTYGKKVGIYLTKEITIKGHYVTDSGNKYSNARCCIYEKLNGLDSTILIDSRRIAIDSIAIKGDNVDEQNYVYTTKRHISTPFDNRYKSYINITDVECCYCNDEAFYVLSYITQIKNCLANECGIGFFVGGNADLDIPSGVTIGGCPANVFEHNYVIGGVKGAYVFNACGYSVINNCFADRCGFPFKTETTIEEEDIYPVFKFYRCGFITINSCANEVASKAIEVTKCTNLIFNACEFSSISQKQENVTWERVVVQQSRNIDFNRCSFSSITEKYIYIKPDVTYGNNLLNNGVLFNNCLSYVGVNSTDLPISNNSFKEPGIIPVIYNYGTDVTLNTYNEVREPFNINSNASNIEPKTIKAYMILYKFNLVNHYGPLVLFFENNDNLENATFYNSFAITNVNDLTIIGKEFIMASANTDGFVITNSKVRVDSIDVRCVSTKLYLKNNTTLILKRSAVTSQFSALDIICDATSIIKVVDDNGNYYLSKDGLTNVNSGSTRPTNIEVGHSFFDTTLNKPIYWNGTAWVDATGTSV